MRITDTTDYTAFDFMLTKDEALRFAELLTEYALSVPNEK
jgi:hypothetical protein